MIDQKILNFNGVYVGSGATDDLVEIDPKSIVRLADAKVAEISESLA